MKQRISLKAEGDLQTKTVLLVPGVRLFKRSLVDASVQDPLTKEPESALLALGADIAVHYLKDMPTDLPGNLLDFRVQRFGRHATAGFFIFRA